MKKNALNQCTIKYNGHMRYRGDGKNSLNISTATAFVLAASGIPIAKHGNRALTSKCGSADVLKALNINVDMETSKLEDCLRNIGICFMFAPNHHPAMKHVAQVRQLLGFRTYLICWVLC